MAADPPTFTDTRRQCHGPARSAPRRGEGGLPMPSRRQAGPLAHRRGVAFLIGPADAETGAGVPMPRQAGPSSSGDANRPFG
jgi:hypothetical protein